MSFEHALIMAAGRGTRMLPLTDAIPKPMAPFRGSTLIADGISRIAHHIPKIHITIGYKKAVLAAHVIEHGAASVFNTEGKPNSWWIYHTLMSHLDEPIVVLTCDNVTELDFDELFFEYVSLGRPHCMLVPVKPVEGLEGDFIHHRDQVVDAVDRHKPAEIYCSGIQVLNPKRIAAEVPEGADFYDVWRGLIWLGQLKVSRKVPAKWFTVDTIEQLIAASTSSCNIGAG
jgi:N-acetyl-alpha-D-muramate 1-phosphate uridylyltransferase